MAPSLATPEMTPRPYQIEGEDFLAAREAALLAFDTRLGKSMVALRACRRVGARRVLIIGPAISRLSWRAELGKTPVGVLRHTVLPGQAPVKAVLAAPDTTLMIAYDVFSLDTHGWAKALASCPPWDVLILDECQYLKNAGSNRTKAIYGKVQPNCARTWLLSASPTPNHAGEFFPHYRALWSHEDAPKPWSRTRFEDEFCKVSMTPWGRRIAGSANADRFDLKFAPHILRKKKLDVIEDMPPVQHNIIEIELERPPNPGGAILQGRHASELDKLLDSGNSPGAMSIQRELGEAKAAPAARWLAEQLANDVLGKVVVFAWHRSVLDALFVGLEDFYPVMVHGGTSQHERERAVKLFQGTDRVRVFVAQIKAAGTAICLDAADDVAVVEPSWVPLDNYQACCRVENVQTKKPVTVSWLTAPEPFDRQIMRRLSVKTAELAELWD